MSTVLFFNISGHRLGVRLFLAPPKRGDQGGEQRRGSQVNGDKSRRTEQYRPEVKYFIDLSVAIQGSLGAIRWTKTVLESESKSKPVNDDTLESWKSSLKEVIRKGRELLKFLEKGNLSLPEDLKYDADRLLAKANELRNLLTTISQKKERDIQNSLGLVKEAQEILEAVVKKIQDLLDKAKQVDEPSGKRKGKAGPEEENNWSDKLRRLRNRKPPQR